ncbi:MAG: hypothetical protein WBM13_10920 [Bacteroidia bacterium]
MLKKIVAYYKFLPRYLAVLMLLLCAGFTYSGTINFNSPNAPKNNYQEQFHFDKKVVQQKKSDSTTPTNSIVLIEEQEEDTNDDNKNEALLLAWISTAYKYTQQASSLVYTYSFKNCPQPISVPLYVLFHSWKNFIC